MTKDDFWDGLLRHRGNVETAFRKIVRWSEILWVRIAAIAALAFVAVGLSIVFGHLVPDWAIKAVGGDAVDRVLDALTGSMLSVTIFSLSVMVSVHRAVAGSWTPRAHRLLVADNTTMTVLAVFIGAWLFALTATILRSVAFVTPGASVILFGFTMAVVTLIVFVIIRWVVHLESLGSLEQTGTRIEMEATRAMRQRRRRPCLGCNALTEETVIPADAVEIRAARTGWVRHIYEAELDEIGSESGIGVYVLVPVGRFVTEGQVIAQASAGEDVAERIRENIGIGALRSFEQDPRFGLVVLSEVAQKALSPGVNDPGTAIEIIGRILRVLMLFEDERAAPDAPLRSHVWMPPLVPSDLIEDSFAPIARDGAGAVEVQIHLQNAFAALVLHPDEGMSLAALEGARIAWRRAARTLDDESDVARLSLAAPEEVRCALVPPPPEGARV